MVVWVDIRESWAGDKGSRPLESLKVERCMRVVEDDRAQIIGQGKTIIGQGETIIEELSIVLRIIEDLDAAFEDGVHAGIEHQKAVQVEAKAAALTKRFTGTKVKDLAANIENTSGVNTTGDPSNDVPPSIARPTRRSGRLAGRSDASFKP